VNGVAEREVGELPGVDLDLAWLAFVDLDRDFVRVAAGIDNGPGDPVLYPPLAGDGELGRENDLVALVQAVRLAGQLALAAGSSTEKVARLAAAGKRPKQIAPEASLSKATVTYHLQRLKMDPGRGYVGRRVVCEVLGRGGLRVSELCDLKIGRVRLHDAEGARLRIEDAKTAAGERMVELTPDLAEVIVEHIDRLRRAGMPTGPDDYLVPKCSRRPDRSSADREDRRRGGEAGERAAGSEGATPAAENHAAHAEADLHIDRPARQRIRRQVGQWIRSDTRIRP
jgi:integrase